MKKYYLLIVNTILISIMLIGCKVENPNLSYETNVSKQVAPLVSIQEDDYIDNNTEDKTLVFRDVFGQEYETIINTEIAENPYDNKAFSFNGYKLSYSASDYKLGIDVSHHQGKIDWDKVKADGYDFVILRIGYRGYGKTGSLNKDKLFETYYNEASEAGLEIGVYFFAQAINEAEAIEEAQFVLDILEERPLDLYVVYDPESILDDEARTDDVSGEQFTQNTLAFCNYISENSNYNSMIYANMLWEAFKLDLSQLKDFPIWYADYEALPQTPYMFVFWQYSNTGRVDGVNGDVDLDIWMK